MAAFLLINIVTVAAPIIADDAEPLTVETQEKEEKIEEPKEGIKEELEGEEPLGETSEGETSEEEISKKEISEQENIEGEEPSGETSEGETSEEETPEEESIEEERPVVSFALGSPRSSSFNVYPSYFKLVDDEYTYNGEERIPVLTLDDDAIPSDTPDFSYIYTYKILGVEGSKSEVLAAKNAGKYILSATITCTPYTTLFGNKVPDLTRVRIITGEYEFTIDKKVINPVINTSQLVYNGEVQFPTLFADNKALVEGVDFEVVGEKPESKDATTEDEPYTVNINLLNYKFEEGAEADSTDFPVKYTIAKRQVTIATSYEEEYNKYGVYPKIVATSGDKTINLTGKKNNEEVYDFEIVGNKIYDGSNYRFPNHELDYNYNLEPNSYTLGINFSSDFDKNNKVNDTEDNNIGSISYTITKAIIEPDFDALYYIDDLDNPGYGLNQIPSFRSLDSKGEDILSNKVTLVDGDDADELPDVYSTDGTKLNKWAAVGSYYVYLQMNDSLSKYYAWSDLYAVNEDASLAKVGYRINQRNVEFAGWDFKGDSIELTGYFGTYEATFKWVKDASENISLQYNGFNPFQFIDSRGYYPIPQAKYTYKVGETTYNANGIVREDCNYDPIGIIEALKVKLDVGTYAMKISLDSDNYAANHVNANFKVTPKPVTISWSNTTIPFDADKLEPDCEIIGLAPIDEYGFKLGKEDGKLAIQTDDKLVVDYSYYKFDAETGNPVLVCNAPLNYVPDEEGRYAVEAVDIVYKKTGISTKNYVLTGENLMTSYIVGDVNTDDTEGGISVITIDNVDPEEILSIVLEKPTNNEMESIIAAQDEAVASILQAALDDGKNINIYLEANTVTADEIAEKGLILPTQNAVVVDLKLYACIDGSVEKYQLTETGTYKPDIQFSLTQAQAESIGYNSARCFYIARYHGDVKTPDSTQMANPTVTGSGEDTIYTFSLRSNKFSDFAIYTANKPTPIPTNNDHVVPYTGA